MPNPLVGMLNRGKVAQSNQKSIAAKFREFKSSFTGDPQAKINELVASGKVSQAQVDQATQLANLIKGYLTISVYSGNYLYTR